MDSPYFSIMMPAYNSEKHIHLALNSILEQTFTDFEVIALDDGSTDSTYEIIQRYAAEDPRIKAMQNPKNIGNCKTRRAALEEMSGRYVAFLDSDDIWKPEKLQIFAQYLEKLDNTAVCLHSDAEIIDEHGTPTGESFQQRFNKDGKPNSGRLFPQILLTNWLNLSSAVVDRETLLDVGGFRPLENMVTDDWDMWVRFAEVAEFHFINEKLTLYRLHEAGISAPHRVERVAIAREQVFDNILKLFKNELQTGIISRICYLRACNAVTLGFNWRARKYFFEAWVNSKTNFKALLRTVAGR